MKTQLQGVFYKYAFWIGVSLFFIFSIIINYSVPGLSLNVDRWSAMEVGIKAIMEGEYPYNIRDHLGRESSNLPALILLGLPFYLLFGSVGYLQCFAFLLISFLIFKIFTDYKFRVFALAALLFSPAYIYEIYTKSDLFTNYIITLGFTYFIWTHFVTRQVLKTGWVAFFTAMLFLTRLSVVIPVTIILVKKLWSLTGVQKLLFAVLFVFTWSVLMYFCLHNAPSQEVLLNHNPISIQNGTQPFYLSLLYIVAAVILSFKCRSFAEVLYASAILMFVCVFIPFLINLYRYGYDQVIMQSFFDISYFNMAMPFIILSMICQLKENYSRYKI